jgi:hypothetical protein
MKTLITFGAILTFLIWKACMGVLGILLAPFAAMIKLAELYDMQHRQK